MNKNERLKTARERAGLKQDDLAERMGVSQSYIGSLEKNKSFSTDKAKEIAVILNVDWKWLYFGDNTKAHPRDEKVTINDKNEVEFLKLLLIEKEKIILNNERAISDKDEIINLLKEKLAFKSESEKDNSNTHTRTT